MTSNLERRDIDGRLLTERFPILATFRQIQEVHLRQLQRLRTDVTTNLEGSQISEESTAVSYGANFYLNLAFLAIAKQT